MASLLAVVDAESVERERGLLAQERTLALSRNALHGIDEAVARVLYPADHPYRRMGDSERDLSNIRIEHVQSFFQRWYAPHNARLAIVGDFDVDAARMLVDEYFGTIASSHSTPPPRPEATELRPLTGDRRVTYGSLASARQIRMIWPTPAFLTPGDAELDDVAYILGRGESSRLYSRLVTETGMATEVFARQYSFELASYFVIFAEAAPERALDDIVPIIDEEVSRLCEAPPEHREFQRAQYLNRARELITDESLATRAVSLSRIRSPLADDGFYRLEDDLERYAEVTREDVQQAVCRFLPTERRLVVSVVPWDGAPDEGAVVVDEVLP
jgi:predicted Zn-dependent peptidase